ncbi:hypothetical protein PEDI_01420 [Persicobacter diffluens]|uniref:Uncharacterized protein n=1 Tax=Persicobacter diffluens TaxID=981 RepID=A0AAN5AHS1_9BACT|nr:hypothetical protein PEDI_01420 [Persicobacter diffluens]
MNEEKASLPKFGLLKINPKGYNTLIIRELKQAPESSGE